MKHRKASLQDPSFVARLLGWFGRPRPRIEDGETAYPFGSALSSYGENVTAESAMQKSSAVWACVNLRAKTLASLPLNVQNADKTIASGHPLQTLLHDAPNADMSPCDYLTATMANLDLWGNGYTRQHWDDRRTRIVALEPLLSEKMTVARSGRSLIYTYTVNHNEEQIPERDIVHFRLFSLDGIIGLSPIQYASDTIGALAAANTAAAREFKNALKVGGFLKTPPGVVLDPVQRERYRELLAKFGMPENTGKFLLLEAGIEVSATGANLRVNPVDAQLLESRYYGIEEICRAYGVPPPLIGHTDKASSWASSLSGLNQGFLTYCLRPTMVAMEQTLKRRCIAREEWGALDIGFNFRALLRGNFVEQMNAYVQALTNGIHSIDEVRDLEDYAALPDKLGERFRVPMNIAPVDDEADAQPAPAPLDDALKRWFTEQLAIHMSAQKFVHVINQTTGPVAISREVNP